MLRFLRRAALAAAALACVALPARAAPALWAIRDADSTIYLFGTVHVLRPGVVWRTEKIAQALSESREFVFETTGVDDPAAAQPLVASLGLDPGHPLSSKLTPAEYARFAAVAQQAGLPAQGMDLMRPWLAAMTLTLAPIVKAGYDPQSGVELKLIAEAKAAGKPISGFETLEQQLRYLADLPEPLQIELLRSDLDEADKGVGELDAMVAAWDAGDLRALEKDFVNDVKGKYPAIYKRLIVDRNRAFADGLKARLAGSGVSFVAVGAGHLVGPDSVQAELAKRGIKVERIE